MSVDVVVVVFAFVVTYVKSIGIVYNVANKYFVLGLALVPIRLFTTGLDHYLD